MGYNIAGPRAKGKYSAFVQEVHGARDRLWDLQRMGLR